MANNTLELVQAPSLKNATETELKWWPDLYLRKGRMIAEITPDQCNKVAEICRAGLGSSEWSDIPLHDENGTKIGFISYNGRCWLNDVENRIEIPQSGRKTAKQLDAEGWKN